MIGRTIAAVVFFVALSSLGCGGGDSSTSGTPTTSVLPTSEPANGTSLIFSDAECALHALQNPRIEPTETPGASPLPAGTVVTPDTDFPHIYPTEHIVSVSPPDGTKVVDTDVGAGDTALITLRVGFHFKLGSRVNREVGILFGLDGDDIGQRMGSVGTTDTPQSSAGYYYKDRLSVGAHDASVSYCDNAGKAWSYEWSFEVIEG